MEKKFFKMCYVNCLKCYNTIYTVYKNKSYCQCPTKVGTWPQCQFCVGITIADMKKIKNEKK